MNSLAVPHILSQNIFKSSVLYALHCGYAVYLFPVICLAHILYFCNPDVVILRNLQCLSPLLIKNSKSSKYTILTKCCFFLKLFYSLYTFSYLGTVSSHDDPAIFVSTLQSVGIVMLFYFYFIQ